MTSVGDPGPGQDPRRATHREVERKVRVSDAFMLPDLVCAVPGVATVLAGEPMTMTAAYHDTPDLRLIRWGVSLRRREGGPDQGWHLKLPVDGQGSLVRDEVTLPLEAGKVGQVPAEMADLVRALVREMPLVHISCVRTHRAPWALLDGGGFELAELVDDRVEVVEHDEVVRTFREIEIEASVEDDRATVVLDAVVESLIASGGTPGTQTKVGAALGVRADSAPDVVVPPWPRAKDPAGETVQCVLATNVRAFLLADVGVRRGMPDSVHQMRVAARTLRSALRTFAPLVDQQWSTALRDELRWAADSLGTARDTEVQLERLSEHARSLPAKDRETLTPLIGAWFGERLADARAAALGELRAERHLRLLVDLVDAAGGARLTKAARKPASQVLLPLVEEAARRLATAVEGLAVTDPGPQWHRARVKAKRARYAAEAVVPVLGKRARRRAGAFEGVTDLLGDSHDSYVAQQMLRELAGDPRVDGATGYVIGLLDRVEARSEQEAREAFLAIWPEVGRTLTRHAIR